VRALIVDDSRAMRLVIGRIMTDLGFEIADAANGREALDRLTAGPAPNVALVDWNMPEMNGLELVCALRANDRYRATRIVMVTTEVEMAQVVRALEAGADEYVMKPFTKDVLREKLELLQLVSD
jgi:two-component system chemotaxis response regulator CheY